MVIGTIQGWNEEGQVGPAIRSLFEGGCDRVLFLDGAWTSADGSLFGGGSERWSTDNTCEEAREAGAIVVQPEELAGGDGEKRDLLILHSSASPADHLLLLDCDERLVGTIDTTRCPSGHGCVIHRDLAENDLPGLGGEWPRGDYGPEKPLIRWLRFSHGLRCERPGIYHDERGQIQPYLVGAMRRRAVEGKDELFGVAYRALRNAEGALAPEDASLLPIVPGIEIHHSHVPSPERVAAKRRYYDPESVLA